MDEELLHMEVVGYFSSLYGDTERIKGFPNQHSMVTLEDEDAMSLSILVTKEEVFKELMGMKSYKMYWETIGDDAQRFSSPTF